MVTFVIADLVTRLDAAINSIENKTAALNKQGLVEQENNRKEWMEKYAKPFAEFATNIVHRSNQGEPVTEEDCPKILRKSYHSIPFWEGNEWQEREPNTQELKTLKSALQSSIDSKITTTGLKELGFTDIKRLFQQVKQGE